MKTLLIALLATTALASTQALANTSDCAAEITAAVTAVNTSGPVRMDGKMVTPMGEVQLDAEVVPPGNVHMTTTVGGQPMEMIIIGDESWMKTDGGWMPMGAADTTLPSSFGAPGLEQLKTITAEQCLGTQTINGVELLAYTFNMDQAGAPGTNVLYADPATKRAVHIESNADAGNGQTLSMIVSYEYDASITVVAPL